MSNFNFHFVSGSFNHSQLLKEGASFLYSYVYPKLANNFLKNENYQNGKNIVMLDSGAHTVHNNGKSIDLDNLIDYINNNKWIDYYVELDWIPDEFKLNYEKGGRVSWENFLIMSEKIYDKTKLLYVYHIGEPVSYLRQALNYHYPDGSKIDYICLSRSFGVDKEKLDNFYQMCFNEIASSNNKNIKVHGLGVAATESVMNYPFYSCDSSTHIQMGRFQQILIVGQDNKLHKIPIGSRSHHQKKHYQYLPSSAKNWIQSYIKDMGFNFEELVDKSIKVQEFNALSFYRNVIQKRKLNYKQKRSLF